MAGVKMRVVVDERGRRGGGPESRSRDARRAFDVCGRRSSRDEAKRRERKCGRVGCDAPGVVATRRRRRAAAVGFWVARRRRDSATTAD